MMKIDNDVNQPYALKSMMTSRGRNVKEKKGFRSGKFLDVGVEQNRNQVFVPERDILFPYFKFRFRQSRYRISGRKKAGKFVIL